MLSFIEFCKLDEARKNPDMNPKVSAYESLKQYKDDPDVYISFTHDFTHEDSPMSFIKTNDGHRQLNKSSMKHQSKIGINPKSQFDTPLGIFTFPLSVVWDYYDIDRKKTLTVLPFAANRPHIYVMKAKNVGTTFIDDMYSDYGSDKFDKDVRKLHEIWNKIYITDERWELSEEEYDDITKKLKTYEGIINHIIATELEYIPTDQEIGKKTIEEYEFKIKSLKARLHYNSKEAIWKRIYNDALTNAKENNSIMSFWKLTGLMSSKLVNDKQGISSITKWNWLLRQCGYTGFADKSGRRYIHDAEPIQAIFLTKNAFTVLEKVDNKDYKRIEKSLVINNIDDCLDAYNDLKIEIPIILNLLADGYHLPSILDPDITDGLEIDVKCTYHKLMSSATDDNIKFILIKLYQFDGYIPNLISKVHKMWINANQYSSEKFPLSQIWYKKITDKG